MRRKSKTFGAYAADCSRDTQGAQDCIEPLAQDSRFRDEAWQKWPFNMMSQAFLLNQQFLHNVTSNVDGVTQQHEDVVTFTTRQMLDVFSPSNFALTNPEVLNKTMAQGGMNLMRGWQNLSKTRRGQMRAKSLWALMRLG